MLWIFRVFALSSALFGCQVWATNSLMLASSTKTKAHIHNVCFLKMLLGMKKSTNTLPTMGDRPGAFLLLLVPLCCVLLEQPADNQQRLIEQD